MDPESIRPATLTLIAVAFVALAVFLLFSGADEEGNGDMKPLQISRIELKQGDQVKEISPGVALTQDELEWLMAERVETLVNGETSQRRAVAMLVAQMVNNPADRRRLRRARPELRDSLRTALADGADDADAAVADNCRSALAQLWPEQAPPAP